MRTDPAGPAASAATGLPVVAPRPWATLAGRVAAVATTGDAATGNR